MPRTDVQGPVLIEYRGRRCGDYCATHHQEIGWSGSGSHTWPRGGQEEGCRLHSQEELFDAVGISFAEVDHIVDEELQPIIDTRTLVGFEKAVRAVEMELNAAEVAAWLGNYLRVGSEEYRNQIDDDTSDFWMAVSLFRTLGTTAPEDLVLIDLESAFGGASKLIDKVLVLHDNIEAELVDFIHLQGQLAGLLDDEIQLLADEALTAARADAHASVDWMHWVIRVMAITSVISGGLAIWFLIRRIIGPVHRLAEGAKEIGKGNLAFRIDVQQDDELGAVSQAFNLMAARRQEATDVLRARESSHRVLLEGLPDSILRIDSTGAVLDARPASEAEFRLDGPALADAHLPEVTEVARRAIARALATRTTQVFEYQVAFNGNQRDVEARLVPIEGSDQLVRIDREITIRKEAERHLTELVDSKNEILASVSHELRTPLTAVLGFSELLAGAASELEEDERREITRSIAQQAAEVAAIVEDLLVAARSESGHVHVVRESVHLGAQTLQVVEMLDPQPPLEILVLESVPAVGDPIRVRQIIRNLITNALRYGGDRLRADTSTSDSTAYLRLRDDGEGLAPDMWERIFERYARAHDHYRQPDSIGIGLTISRDLARLMDGDLTYSYLDGWSTFELTLPVA